MRSLKDSKECVIWTVNIDKKKSRSRGRRIPKRFAVPNVRLSELVEACKELGIEYQVEEKKYPKCWWEESGRVRIPKNDSKTKLMIDIARKIAEIREIRDKKSRKK
jgi:signal recognition particle subunit SRP19